MLLLQYSSLTNAIIQITSKIGVYRKFNKIIYLSSYYHIIWLFFDGKCCITFVCRSFYIIYNLII